MQKVVTVTVFRCRQENHRFDEYNKRCYDVTKGKELELEIIFYKDCGLGSVKTCCLIRALDRSVMSL